MVEEIFLSFVVSFKPISSPKTAQTHRNGRFVRRKLLEHMTNKTDVAKIDVYACQAGTSIYHIQKK